MTPTVGHDTKPRPAAAAEGERSHDDFANYYNSARTELLDLLGPFRPTRALEVGCGGGANLALLRQRFPDCHTTGIEQDTAAAALAKAASAADDLWIGDVESPAITFGPDAFDLVILSHVLEHFDDPGRVLRRVLTWTRPEARLLVALPNIRHYSVLVDLIVRGDFRYRPHGILDRTHLRFFTRLSASRFLESEGLEIRACRPEVSGRLSRLIHAASGGLASGFAAYAYNFCLTRPRACES